MMNAILKDDCSKNAAGGTGPGAVAREADGAADALAVLEAIVRRVTSEQV
ncbi:MAG: hypothetical protein ABWX70_10985 [Hyphomicrobium sp.]